MRSPLPGAAVPAVLAVLAGTALPGCGGEPAPVAVVEATIAVEPHVGPDIEVAPDGDVWLPASDTFGGTEVPYERASHALVRIDGTRDVIAATVAVPHPMVAVAIGAGGVWATGTDYGPDDEAPRGSAVRIDPATNAVALTVDLGQGSPSDVAVGFGSVWVADSSAELVYRLDPGTGAVLTTIAVDGGPTSLAVTDEEVWVTKPGRGEVRPIDPGTNRPGAPVGTGTDPSVIEAGGAGLFVADYAEADLARIDPRRGRVAETVSLPSAPSRFDVGDDVVVVSEVEERTLSVIRGDDREVVLEDRVLVAVALTRDGRSAWVAEPVRGVSRVALPEA